MMTDEETRDDRQSREKHLEYFRRYSRERYRRQKKTFDERLDAIRVARYLETGELPSVAQMARELGVTVRRIKCDLAKETIPDMYGDYAHAPTPLLNGHGGVLVWLKG